MAQMTRLGWAVLNTPANDGPDDNPRTRLQSVIDTSDWMTVRQAAGLMGSSPTAIRRMIEAKTIESREQERPQGKRYLVKLPEKYRCVQAPEDAANQAPDAPPPTDTVPVTGPEPKAGDPSQGWGVVELALTQLVAAHQENARLIRENEQLRHDLADEKKRHRGAVTWFRWLMRQKAP